MSTKRKLIKFIPAIACLGVAFIMLFIHLIFLNTIGRESTFNVIATLIFCIGLILTMLIGILTRNDI